MPSVDPAKEVNRPNQDEHRKTAEGRGPDGGPGRKRRQATPQEADTEDKAESRSNSEPVRNTPPSGDWDDTSPD